MYIAGTQITVRWVLPPTGSPLTAGDYDVYYENSDLDTTYTDGAVTSFVSPTATTPGSMTYAFTPARRGKHTVFLTVGTSTAHDVLDQKIFWVFQEAPTSVGSTRAPGALSFPPGFINKPLANTNGSPGWNDLGIYSVGYDGNNTILVGVLDYNNFGTPRLLKTDTSFSPPTKIDMTDIPSWTSGTFKEFNYIVYSPTLSRWVAACGRNQFFYCNGADDPIVGANWTEITYPVGFTGGGRNNRNLVWDHGLQMFMAQSDIGFGTDYLMVSVDGITFYDQADYQVLGGSLPAGLKFHRQFNIGATTHHIVFQQEEYIHKTGNANAGTLPGAAQGWTKSNNNSVVNSTTVSNINGVASDGSVLAIASGNEFNASDFSLSHPDRWGPDGIANEGWEHQEMGWTSFNTDITVLFYLPQYERPWIAFRSNSAGTVDAANHGWFDCASVDYSPIRSPQTAPQFARCTVEPFKTLNDELDLNQWHFVADHQINGTGYGAAHYDGVAGAPLGTRGFWIIMRTELAGRTEDYIVFQPPGA